MIEADGAAGFIERFADSTTLRPAERSMLSHALTWSSTTDDQRAAIREILRTTRPVQEDRHTEAQRQAAEAHETAMQKAAEDTRRAEGREQVADLRGALAEHGSLGVNQTDALALLQPHVTEDADAAAVAVAIDTLKVRRPELFGITKTEPRRKPVGLLPAGKPGRRARPPAATPGARGLAHAERRGFIATETTITKGTS